MFPGGCSLFTQSEFALVFLSVTKIPVVCSILWLLFHAKKQVLEPHPEACGVPQSSLQFRGAG